MSTSKIFVYWNQGELKAPILVKKCINSIKRNSNGHEVVILDDNNLYNWITPFSKKIERKFEKNVFSIQLKSDLIRFSILAKYCGLWIDSTVFVSQPIPLEVFDKSFFTVVRKESKVSDITGKISPFLIGRSNDQSGKKLFMFAKDMMTNYIEQEDDLINYLLIENILNIGISKDEKLKNCLNYYSNNKKDILRLADYLNCSANNNIVKNILSENVFNKLNYHKTYNFKTKAGFPTVYSNLINGAY